MRFALALTLLALAPHLTAAFAAIDHSAAV
jgi:hypothetical protein